MLRPVDLKIEAIQVELNEKLKAQEISLEEEKDEDLI